MTGKRLHATAYIGAGTLAAAFGLQSTSGGIAAASGFPPHSSPYNGAAAAVYANTWWGGEDDSGNNSAYFPLQFKDDCTDFVSQALAAGGLTQYNYDNVYDYQSPVNWYFQTPGQYSYSWTVANDLKTFLVNDPNGNWGSIIGNQSPTTTVEDDVHNPPSPPGGTGQGTVIFWDLSGTGNIDHTTIVTAFGGEPQAGQPGYLGSSWQFGDAGLPSVWLSDQHSAGRLKDVYTQYDDITNTQISVEMQWFVNVNR
jgi:hypothetical protein